MAEALIDAECAEVSELPHIIEHDKDQKSELLHAEEYIKDQSSELLHTEEHDKDLRHEKYRKKNNYHNNGVGLYRRRFLYVLAWRCVPSRMDFVE